MPRTSVNSGTCKLYVNEPVRVSNQVTVMAVSDFPYSTHFFSKSGRGTDAGGRAGQQKEKERTGWEDGHLHYPILTHV